MWVETLGLPGAGKTTFYSNHADKIASRYRIVDSKSPDLIQRITAKCIYLTKTRAAVKDRNYALKMAYRASFRCGLGRANNIYFEDSGIIQPCLENLIETDFLETDEKLALMHQMSRPDILLYFDLPLETSLERELSRVNRRYTIGESNLKTRYQKAIKLLENILPGLAETIINVTDDQQEDVIKRLLS